MPMVPVSKPIFATKYSFFSILRDLQDLHTFAPLQTQNLRKNSSNVFRIFARISAKIFIFRQLSSNFAPILMIFSWNFGEHSRKCWEVWSPNIFIISDNFWRIVRIFDEFWQNFNRILIWKFEWFGPAPTESFNSGPPGNYSSWRSDPYRGRDPLPQDVLVGGAWVLVPRPQALQQGHPPGSARRGGC